MNLRKFVAANSRDCLKMMREALGDDAMVVSTRNTPEGVEIVGASAEYIHSVQDEVPAHLTSVAEQRSGVTNLPDWDDDESSVTLSPAARVLSSSQHTDERLPHPSQMKPKWPKVSQREMNKIVRSTLSKPNQETAQTPVHSSSDKSKKESHQTSDKKVAPLVARGNTVSDTERALLSAMDAFASEHHQDFDDVPATSPQLRRLPTPAPAINIQEAMNPLMDEVRQMRSWLEQQMQALTWKDATQREPLRRECWRMLVSAGISSALARQLIADMPEDVNESVLHSWICQSLETKLNTVSLEESMTEKGGVYALIGPTGVGKTTSTAKLAARCVVKYGARSLGLITTDQYRIGAVDQLRTFGKILGVDVYTARTAQDLDTMLKSMENRKLVLIDTTGIGQKDKRMTEHLDVFSANGVERILVMTAGTHVEQAEDIVHAYEAVGLSGLLLSKLDESVRIGGVIDVAIRHQLPLHYITTGQRVPEDLHMVNLQLLIHRTMKQHPHGITDMDDLELDWASTPMVDPSVARDHTFGS